MAAARIQQLNGEFRSKPTPTDVLAFPYHDFSGVSPAQAKLALPELECDRNLGDVVVCPTVISRQAEEDGLTLGDRLPVVLVHAVHHLLGCVVSG